MRPGRISLWAAWVVAAMVGLGTANVRAEPTDAAAGPGASREAIAFFETFVRPLLAANCYECHGPDKQKGGLRLDSRSAILRGGEIGPALVPGKPDQSAIVRAIAYTDPDLRMPPKKRLSPEKVDVLTRWVAMGAPWPGGGAAEVVEPAPASPGAMRVTDADRAHWSFRPVTKPTAPQVQDPKWSANPIDAFVLSNLEQKGLHPSPPAEPRELLRRASFDLTGLPPSLEEHASFLADSSPEAWSRAIDRLLASPRYGERWARHWLDVVRYAQTNGYERDDEKPHAWRYRDYVIGAFNADKPYDQFVREQLAGDELDAVTDESIVATGFYRIGVWDDEPDDKLGAEYDYHDDNLRTIGAAFLGLTVGCARCHDHKFDPIPQADYYRLLAFIHNVRPHERPRYTRDSGTYVPLGPREPVERWYAEREAMLAPLRQQLEAVTAPVRQALVDEALAELPDALRAAYATDPAQRTKDQKRLAGEAAARVTPREEEVIAALSTASMAEHARIEQEVRKIEKQEPLFDEWALAVLEHGPAPARTHVLARGSAAAPGSQVQPGFLQVIENPASPPPAPTPRAQSTGLRRALADWLVRPDHPLTARVIVNRVWHHHFGRGIVQTVDDFGKTGTPPTHPELLDWLASRFIEEGWSLKRLHKLTLESNTYRMSSRAGGNPAAAAADPGNGLLWRQNMRRLEAEAVRDSVLAVSGTLNTETGGRGFFPRLSREAIASGSRPGDGWGVSTAAERNRRSIYAYLKRSQLLPMLEMFDFNNTAMPSGERASTIVSPQALLLLNDDFMHENAAALARRVMADAPDRQRRIERAYALALGRAPTASELEVADRYVDRQAQAFAASAHQMTFRPQVPSALDERYLAKLDDADLLSGPADGWHYGRGTWGGSYEYIVNVDPARGPFALAEAPTFADGTLTARLRLHVGAELGGLILRGTKPAPGASHAGYDVILDSERQSLAVRRHEPDKVVTLASAPMAVHAGRWYALRVEAAGSRLSVWIDGAAEPVLITTDPGETVTAGNPGVRVWGAPMDVDGLTVESSGATTLLAEGLGDADRTERQALASFCLVLLNLNEFVYVD